MSLDQLFGSLSFFGNSNSCCIYKSHLIWSNCKNSDLIIFEKKGKILFQVKNTRSCWRCSKRCLNELIKFRYVPYIEEWSIQNSTIIAKINRISIQIEIMSCVTYFKLFESIPSWTHTRRDIHKIKSMRESWIIVSNQIITWLINFLILHRDSTSLPTTHERSIIDWSSKIE